MTLCKKMMHARACGGVCAISA